MVASWLGNTPKVAEKHYLDIAEEDFQKAAAGFDFIELGDAKTVLHRAEPEIRKPAKRGLLRLAAIRLPVYSTPDRGFTNAKNTGKYAGL